MEAYPQLVSGGIINMPHSRRHIFNILLLTVIALMMGCANKPVAVTDLPQSEDAHCREQGFAAGNLDYWACRERKTIQFSNA